MKSFFKFLLASTLGVLIASLIMFFITVGILTAMIASADKPTNIKSNSILLLKLDKPIKDRKSSMPALSFNIINFGTESDLGLNDILKNIRKAKEDDNIKGIYLQLSGMQTGIATIEEIRNALIDFKASGKFIVAFSEIFSQGSYYLASVSDRIYITHGGSLPFTGLSADLFFYKNMLEKLDLEPEIIRHGKFKSAVEPFMNDKMSDENREQIKTYVGSIWHYMLGQIAESRKTFVENLNTLADNLLFWDNNNLIRYDLIDGILYKDQVLDTLANLVDISKAKDLEFVSHGKYLRVPEKSEKKKYSSNKVAVIYAEGDIVSGDQGDGYIGSERIARTIREARQDSSIKAIVFRINSGGGSALASETIWRELDLARQAKPLIASMGDVAASGGYYIAAPADTIVASPNTITGSIGVFGLLLNARDFLKNKLGITTDVEKTNTYADFPSFTRPLTTAERTVLQQSIDYIYQTFVNRVSSGRDMPFAEVDKIGEGRVWSGINAQERGLVDVFGGLNTAINIAVEKAGLESYRIVELPKQEDPLAQILKELTGEVKARIIKNELAGQYRHFKYLENLLKQEVIQARMPFEMTVQ